MSTNIKIVGLMLKGLSGETSQDDHSSDGVGERYGAIGEPIPKEERRGVGSRDK